MGQGKTVCKDFISFPRMAHPSYAIFTHGNKVQNEIVLFVIILRSCESSSNPFSVALLLPHLPFPSPLLFRLLSPHQYITAEDIRCGSQQYGRVAGLWLQFSGAAPGLGMAV